VADRLIFVLNAAKFFLTHRLPVADAARAAGFEVHVAAPDGPEAATIRVRGYEFHPIVMGRGTLGPWGEFQSVRSLYRLYRRLQPTLVHHLALKPVLYGSYAAGAAGVPHVVNAVTGLGYLFTDGDLRARLLRSAFVGIARPVLRWMPRFTIFQNEDDLEIFVSLGLVKRQEAVLIRGSGVDPDVFRPPAEEPPGPPIVMLPSRMLWDKGVGEFVASARSLSDHPARPRFVLVGDPDHGNPRSVTTEQLETWQRDGIVEWWGHRSGMAGVLAGSTIVALPSTYREGVPKVLIEAASCARAIVTTDMPGCRDIVRDGVNGLLVRPKDSDSLTGALARLLDDPTSRVRMGFRGRALVKREFAEELVVSSTLDVYESVLKRAVDPALAN
jgi:glycosyltransferase involved in cell wall biosynthesis